MRSDEIASKSSWLRPWILVFTSIIVCAVVVTGIYWSARAYFINKAETQVQNLLLHNRAVHQYVQRDTHPEMYESKANGSIVEYFYSPVLLSSSYMIRVIQGYMNEERSQAGLPEVYYKLAAINPRNPVNVADSLERRVIDLFNTDSTISIYRQIVEIDGKKQLYVAVPFLRTTKNCLACHGDPREAPSQLAEQYKEWGGYHTNLGEIRAIESVRAPIETELHTARIFLVGLIVTGLLISLLIVFGKRLNILVHERTRQLWESEAKYRCLAEEACDGIAIVQDSVLKYVNPSLASTLGRDREQLLGTELKDLLVELEPEDDVILGCEGCCRNRIDGVHSACMRTSDGRLIDVEYSLASIEYESREAELMFIRDVTLCRKAESELSKTQALLRAAIDQTPAGILVADAPDVSIRIANPAALGIRGDSDVPLTHIPVELHPMNWQVYKTDGRPFEGEDLPLSRAVLEGATSRNVEAIIRREDGEERWVSANAAPVRDQNGEIVAGIVVFLDVTENRRMERELAKAEKLESLGVLAGGIAHDFNNILMGILGNISLARLDIDPNSEVSKILLEAERASERAKGLTRQLLTYAKGGSPIKETVSIANLIRENCDFAVRGSNVKLSLNLEDGSLDADVDVDQFGQVMSNLTLNAVQAMPNGGCLNVMATAIDVGESDRHMLSTGKYIRIVFSDQGVGIADEQISKIFDPFYTTKKNGNGLGLSTAYSIVREHGGHIEAKSIIGEGTDFTVYLPVSTKRADDSESEDEHLVKGSGRVLLMDDEEVVRNVGKNVLQKLGYDAVTVSDGVEAIDAFERAYHHGNEFDVVILDLTIPGGMGGKDTIIALRRIDPEVKAIVSSGYSGDDISSNHQEWGFCGVVPKPYRVRDLGRALREALSTQHGKPARRTSSNPS